MQTAPHNWLVAQIWAVGLEGGAPRVLYQYSRWKSRLAAVHPAPSVSVGQGGEAAQLFGTQSPQPRPARRASGAEPGVSQLRGAASSRQASSSSAVAAGPWGAEPWATASSSSRRLPRSLPARDVLTSPSNPSDRACSHFWTLAEHSAWSRSRRDSEFKDRARSWLRILRGP